MSNNIQDALQNATPEQLAQALEKANQEKKKQQRIAKNQFIEDKDLFCEQIATAFKELNGKLSVQKDLTITRANKLYERMFEINDKEPKSVKTFTLKNEDDTIKVTVDRQERFEFTEEAVVHISAIKDIFKEKFAKRNQGLYNLLDSLLIKNSKMEYDPKLLAKARKQVKELGDEKLIEEFDKLQDCQRVIGSSTYCRVYVKYENGKYQDVSLNFSSL